MKPDSQLPKLLQTVSDKNFRAADFGRRLLAFCIDAVWGIGLGILVAELAISINMRAHEATFSIGALILGMTVRDMLFGGRSLGRRLSFSYLVRHDSLKPISPAKTVPRNLLAALMLFAPGFIGVFVGLEGDTAGLFVIGGIMLALKGATGHGGQSWWDEICGTLVVTKAEPGDQVVTPTKP